MKAAVDRIEGSIAVLIPRDDDALRIHLPVALLPPDCREGDIVTITLERDARATEDAKERARNLIGTLDRQQ